VNASYHRTYPQSSQAVGRARREVVDFAEHCGFRGQALADIEVAVGEGLANAVEHSQRTDGGFEVSVSYGTAGLIVEIKDSGRGFDSEKMCARARPPVEALRGFGSFIMRELMDEVAYSESGTRLKLIKRLPRAARERSSLQA
jgi:anti-sigma regulatory factor (Ser/Thr protein kinase)